MTARTARASVLPSGCLPRGLAREQAAEYVGISARLFDEMVEDGRMPKPKCINARKVWDRLALDTAFAGLPEGAERNMADEVW